MDIYMFYFYIFKLPYYIVKYDTYVIDSTLLQSYNAQTRLLSLLLCNKNDQ